MDTGACDAAIPLLEQIADDDTDPERAAVALFDAGRCHERLGDLDSALRAYDTIAQRHRRTAAWRDGLFRRGLTQLQLDQHAEALRDFRRLRRTAGDAPRERAVLGIEIGACHQSLGRPRAAVDELAPALEVLDGLDPGDDPDLAWYRAHAHFVFGELLAGAFDGSTLDTPDAASQRAALQEQRRHLDEAIDHYQVAIDTDGPLWACAGAVRMGELYERFAAAVDASPPPEGLRPHQRDVYAAELERVTDGVRDRAEQIYQDTLDFAAQARVHNRWVGRARENLDRMRAAR